MHSIKVILVRKGLYYVNKTSPLLFQHIEIEELTDKAIRAKITRLLHSTCSSAIKGICCVKSCVLPTTKRILVTCAVVVQVKSASSVNEEAIIFKKGNQFFSWVLYSELVTSKIPCDESLEVLKFVESSDNGKTLLPLNVLSGSGSEVQSLGRDEDGNFLVFENLSKEQKALKAAAGFGNLETEALLELYLKNSWPSSRMNFEAFCDFMNSSCDFGATIDLQQLFKAINTDVNGKFLSFVDFVLGLAALQPTVMHGNEPGLLRTRYIFSYYCSAGFRGTMSEAEQRRMLSDIVRLRNAKGTTMSEAEIEMAAEKILQVQESFKVDDLVKQVGKLKLRGSSALLRLTENIFPRLRNELELSKSEKPCENCASMKKKLKDVAEGSFTHSPSSKRPRRSLDVSKELETEPAVSYTVSRHSLQFSASGSVQEVEHLNNLEECMTQSAKIEMDLLPMSQPSDTFDGLKSLDIEHANEVLRGLNYFRGPWNSRQLGKKKRECSWAGVKQNGLAECYIRMANVVKDILYNEPRCLELKSPTYILGDIHGNYKDLITFEESLWRLGPVYCPANLLFLGDYVDRGSYSFETVAYLFAQKVLAPNKVWLLRGNHELRRVQMQFNFQKECHQKFGAYYGNRIWNKTNECFDMLPLAAILDGKILCIHGGIPHPVNFMGSSLIEAINAIVRPLPEPVLGSLAWDLMWNDPEWTDEESPDLDSEGFGKNVKRGNARVFSCAALAKFLATHGFSHVVRAHQVQQEGFQLRYKAQLLTVFSSSSYVGMNNGAACVMAQNGKLKFLRIQRQCKTKGENHARNSPGPKEKQPKLEPKEQKIKGPAKKKLKHSHSSE